MAQRWSRDFCAAIAVSEWLYPEAKFLKWRFPAGVPDERFLLVGVEVNATFQGS
jgi:hypothetical protein